MATDEHLEMTEDCEVRESRLTEWECKFIDSISNQIKSGRKLSPKQEETLNRIWKDVTARDNMAEKIVSDEELNDIAKSVINTFAFMQDSCKHHCGHSADCRHPDRDFSCMSCQISICPILEQLS